MQVNQMTKDKIRIRDDSNMFDYNSYLKGLVLKMLNKNKKLRPKASDALDECNFINIYKVN